MKTAGRIPNPGFRFAVLVTEDDAGELRSCAVDHERPSWAFLELSGARKEGPESFEAQLDVCLDYVGMIGAAVGQAIPEDDEKRRPVREALAELSRRMEALRTRPPYARVHHSIGP